MFGLFRRARPDRVPSIPAGTVLYAIGDIHGRLDLLTQLLARIVEDARHRPETRRLLVFVGDYIDRGPHSMGVIERLIEGVPGFEAIFLKGNHEQVLLDFLDNPALWEDWRRFGGLETLASYGLPQNVLFGAGAAPEKIRDAFQSLLPDRHRDFLTALAHSHRCGDYYFVHAGARPGIPLDRQVAADQLWIRDEFLNAGNVFGGAVVVHGHTPTDEPEKFPFRLGIDTGAYLSGRLTAVRLCGTTAEFLQT